MSAQPKWEIKQLSTIADRIDYGHTASANAQPVGPKLLRITDIQSGRVEWNDVPYCLATTEDIRKYELMDGDIVFARTGNTTGKSFLLKSPPPYTVFASYLIRVRPGSSVEPRFLAHFFNTPNYWTQIEKNTEGAGQPGVNASRLKTLEIPLPPLSEQKRIANILDKADAIRRKRQEAIILAEQLIRSTFLKLFGDPIQNPMKWPVKKLREISTRINSGSTPKGGEAVYVPNGITFFRSQNVWRNRLELDDIAYIDEETHRKLSKSSLKHKDILITKTGRFNTENSSLGRAAIFLGTDDSANVNGHVYLVRLMPEAIHEYILYILTTDEYRAYIRSVCVGGIDKRQINKEHLEEFPIISPPRELQLRFAEIVKSAESHAAKMRDSLSKSNSLFSSLQSRAFQGEL